jgi:hypothetical protein
VSPAPPKPRGYEEPDCPIHRELRAFNACIDALLLCDARRDRYDEAVGLCESLGVSSSQKEHINALATRLDEAAKAYEVAKVRLGIARCEAHEHLLKLVPVCCCGRKDCVNASCL